MSEGENTCVRQALFRHEIIVLLVVSSVLTNQQNILNYTSLNRNTYITRLCIDLLMKMQIRGLKEPKPIQAHLRDIAGLVPNHHKKVNITIT